MKALEKKLVFIFLFLISISKIFAQDIYEPNDNISEASITAFATLENADYSNTISANFQSSMEQDYYKLKINGIGSITIDLKNFTGDYDLYLVDKDDNILEYSSNMGSVNESITFNIITTDDYYISVNALDWNDQDNYALSVVWAPIPMDVYETNNTITNANKFAFSTLDNLTYSKSINATISVKEDLDYYLLHVKHAGELNVKLSDLPVDFDLFLNDSMGKTIIKSTNYLTQSDSITVILSDTGKYYIFIDPANNSSTSEYKLAVSWKPVTLSEDIYESNNSLITANTSAFSALGNSIYNKIINANTHSLTDKDYYKVNITETGFISLELPNISEDFRLKLLDSKGNEIAVNYFSDKISGGIINKGDYIISIYNIPFSNPGDYSLTLQWKPGQVGDSYEINDSISIANNLAFPVLGNINAKDSIKANMHIASDQDYYKLTINNTGNINIDLQKCMSVSNVELLKSNGEILATATGTNLALRLNTVIETPGIYYLYIAANAANPDTTSYKVLLNWVPETISGDIYESNNSLATANISAFLSNFGAIDVSKIIQATIHTKKDSDYYKINVIQKGIINVSLNNLPATYLVALYDKEENLLMLSISSADKAAFSYDIDVADEYYIVVYTTDNASLTPYSLMVNWQAERVDAYEPNNSIATANTSAFSSLESIHYEKSIKANIRKAGDKDLFELTVIEKGQLSIKLSSLPQNYDLILFDKDSNILGQSNHVGLINDSILYTVENAGKYYIYVYSKTLENSNDEYNLNVNWLPNTVIIGETIIGKLSVYPNPTVDIVNLEGSILEGAELKVFNNIGIVILETKVLSENIILNVMSYQSGIYFVKISKGNITQTETFVKK